MKKNVIFFRSLIGILPFLFLGTACSSDSDDPEPTPFLTIAEADKAISFTADNAAPLTITVSTNVSDWSASADAANRSWCTVTPNPSDKTISISVSANTGVARTATVTVTAGSLTPVTITVTQAAAGSSPDLPSLTIADEDKNINLNAAGVAQTITVTTNVSDWSATANANWCTAVKGTGTLAISATPNTGAERTATVTVTAGDLTPVIITVTQEAATPSQTINTNFSISGYEGQTLEVAFVDNNTPGSLTLDASGNGVLATTHTQALTIKSIKATEGKDILIGRKEDSGNIILSVDNSTHAVKWRTKTDDNATALIGTAAELSLRFHAEDPVTNYEFEADIDLMDQEWTPVSSLAEGKTVDGQQHKIYNLNITSEETEGYWGIFKQVHGSIINLHIASGTITVTGDSGSSGSNVVGTFAGYLVGQIKGCSNRATVNSNSCGGICGRISVSGKISGCANYGNITSTSRGAAGICYFQNNTSTIEACYNAGTIASTASGTNSYYTGGIVGRFSAGTITSCYNIGTITKKGSSTDTTVGAINGSFSAGNNPVIENCYYSANSYTSAGTSNDTSKTFSEGWPTDNAGINWGVGTTGTDGAYWSSLGTSGTTNYPKLYWE
ncbi:hypothetical protein EZS27_021334 [termite gut metagenome]|uniref:BACON domain-containing protein n=1 Tax=termite gut metagenome TaxID=433724 RepID=A0A5J4R9B9_9ZZZZ